VFDSSCASSDACTEGAYKLVGASSSPQSVQTVFYEVPACALVCSNEGADSAFGFYECVNRA